MAEGEELQRAVCHLSLDVLDAGGSCVFSGFGVIIKEVWGTTEVSVRVKGWRGDKSTYRVSSGRDIVRVLVEL